MLILLSRIRYITCAILHGWVVFEPGLLQADGIHPNEQGQSVLLDNVWQVLEPALG